MTNAKTSTVLQFCSGKLLLSIIGVGLAVLTCGSCSGYFMTSPPIRYVSVDLLAGAPESPESGAVEWTIYNSSAKEIVWMEISFTLYTSAGVQFPAFGGNYFTARVITEIRPANEVTLAASLAPHVALIPADARVGLFFVRSVRFSDGTKWWNFGSYRYNGREA